MIGEKEEKILETIDEALPKMSEFEKGYFLGQAERMVLEKENNKNETFGEREEG